MNPISEDILVHYGVKRRSGRYPWGSGDSPYQHSGDFISRVEELKKLYMSEKEIANELGLSTTDLRMQLRVAKHERRNLEADRARSLIEDGKTLNEVAQEMGYKNDSSIRSLLNENTYINKNRAKQTAEILKKELETKGMIDVGAGVEIQLGVSAATLNEAMFILETEGYNRYGVGVPNVTNKGKQTITTVLTNSDITYQDAYNNMGDIQQVRDFHSNDAGTTFNQRQYPASLDLNRVHIRYGDQGGVDKDGVIELRRGVKDLSLGDSHYAQVRILVNGTHYLKGMAMYSDDMPPGADIVFNTNKKSDKAPLDVMKPIKDDPKDPFGAYIKANGQSTYIDKDGVEKLSPINKLKEEGDWDSMSRNLSSQFLSKQPYPLIKKQLDLTFSDSETELENIMALTNPTVKKKMLMEFANECDGAVVHLKAAALPRQKTQVLLPITSMKETEIYAPNYQNGERIALVRFPHGGTFEIPVLVVNNKNKQALALLGPNIKDAVGIHPKVAEQLSGADFDGDQAVCIPVNNKVKVHATKPLEGLKNFNPKEEYPETPGMTYMTKKTTQKQMGMISNLITDMTLIGAKEGEIVRAVKHSMVVIDAEKHKLNYKESEKRNGIAELKQKYQGYTTSDGRYVGGASTLLSRRKQDIQVPERQGGGRIDKDTGIVTYKETGRVYTDPKTGTTTPAMTKVKLLNHVGDVRTLSSGTMAEDAYADYANGMKALANQARKAAVTTGNLVQDRGAKAKYASEVEDLDRQLRIALMNAPKERRAQVIANTKVKAKTQENPGMEKSEIKKISQQAIYDARFETGASGKNTRVTISDKQWEAIQAGAISEAKLSKILRYTDTEEIKQRATPKTVNQLSQAKISKLKSMRSSGYTNDEIAKALGVSTSTVVNYS